MQYDTEMWNLVHSYISDSTKLMMYSNREMQSYLRTRDIRHLKRANFCLELARRTMSTTDSIIEEHLKEGC